MHVYIVINLIQRNYYTKPNDHNDSLKSNNHYFLWYMILVCSPALAFVRCLVCSLVYLCMQIIIRHCVWDVWQTAGIHSWRARVNADADKVVHSRGGISKCTNTVWIMTVPGICTMYYSEATIMYIEPLPLYLLNEVHICMRLCLQAGVRLCSKPMYVCVFITVVE